MKGTCIYCEFPITYVVIFDKGDEFTEGIKQFAHDHNLAASRITAIGSFSDVVLGYFDRQRMGFKEIPVAEQVEVLSLVGDISLENDEPRVHVHAVVGKSDGSAMGGHLLKAHVWPTLEVLVTESPGHLRRAYDPETRLMLIDIQAEPEPARLMESEVI